LHRHAHHISMKKGYKFESGKSNWTKYKYFLSMYKDVEAELVIAGLAVKFEKPIWMDEKGSWS
jgi:hypothetical protein